MSNLAKSLGGKSESGSSGNNSDNSALVSIGNTSFGFNFDSEEGPNSSNSNSEEGDSDEGARRPKGDPKTCLKGKPQTTPKVAPPKVSSGSDTSSNALSSHSAAAAEAVANLQSIADKVTEQANKQASKRKSQDTTDNDSGGYNTDDEGKTSRSEDNPSKDSMSSRSVDGSEDKNPRKKNRLGEMKREERNAREKERSFRISKQINDLRNLLSTGGVIVPKGTKSSVLTEAANYIRMLQQHQYRSEIDRHQLVQQIQMIGGGALGQPAATAVRHVAAQNGVWSLGNFGGVPPKSAMMYHQPGAVSGEHQSSDLGVQQASSQSQDATLLPSKISDPDYRYVFNSSTVGMAIASMGGAFIDCNKLFGQLSEYSKQEVCSMTIFNITARSDLQHAFDLISQMLSAPTDSDGGNKNQGSCVLRSSLKNREDLGLSVTLIKGDDGVAKCFCVTLVLNHTSPYDTSKPMPATIEHVQHTTAETEKNLRSQPLDQAPAYTTG